MAKGPGVSVTSHIIAQSQTTLVIISNTSAYCKQKRKKQCILFSKITIVLAARDFPQEKSPRTMQGLVLLRSNTMLLVPVQCCYIQGSKPYYLEIVATAPAPTVRPPSRMENLVPSSIAIGLIS